MRIIWLRATVRSRAHRPGHPVARTPGRAGSRWIAPAWPQAFPLSALLEPWRTAGTSHLEPNHRRPPAVSTGVRDEIAWADCWNPDRDTCELAVTVGCGTASATGIARRRGSRDQCSQRTAVHGIVGLAHIPGRVALEATVVQPEPGRSRRLLAEKPFGIPSWILLWHFQRPNVTQG